MADVGKQMEYFLATGNLKSRSGLSLQQVREILTASTDAITLLYSKYVVSCCMLHMYVRIDILIVSTSNLVLLWLLTN